MAGDDASQRLHQSQTPTLAPRPTTRSLVDADAAVAVAEGGDAAEDAAAAPTTAALLSMPTARLRRSVAEAEAEVVVEAAVADRQGGSRWTAMRSSLQTARAF